MLDRRISEPPLRNFAERIADCTSRYLHKAAQAVAVWRERAELERELMSLDDAGLADLGLARGQIRNLVSAHPAAAMQLDDMLERLGLSKKGGPVDHLLRDDLYRTCVMCTERARCRDWLASPRRDEGYRAFCPNRWVFDRLLDASKAPIAAGD